MLRTTPITHTEPLGSGNAFGRKWSDVGTGLGSALAFITSSQTYELHGLRGVAYLGLAIAVLKCATSIAIGMALPRSGRCTSTSKI